MPHAIYLGGDSYPGDAHCEEQVVSELNRSLGLTFTRQSELLPTETEAAKNWLTLASRYEHIQKKLNELSDNEIIILIGRSSGSRVATSFASTQSQRSNLPDSNIAAIVCFAYPFRVPHQKIEPSRFAHLADINIPTLIIQGTKDEYGGADVHNNYALSPAVEFLLVEADHGVNLSADEWEKTFQYITIFLTKAVYQFRTKRAEKQALEKKYVRKRSVYYFGGIDTKEAKNHYLKYLSYAQRDKKQKFKSVNVTPLQWQPNQTFWDITVSSIGQNNENVVTDTLYQLFECDDVACPHLTGINTSRWDQIKQSLKTFDITRSLLTIFNPNKRIKNKESDRRDSLFKRTAQNLQPELEARIRLQAQRLIARMQSNSNEETVLIGHEVGGILAVQCLIKAWELNPAIFTQKSKVYLLTFGLNTELAKLMPETERFISHLGELKLATELKHIDIENNIDARTNGSNHGMTDSESDLFVSNKYDYFDITAGPETFSEIFSIKLLPEIPESFDPTTYLKLNPDVALQNLDPVWHWQHYGALENRPHHMNLPFGFNANTYLELNPDVAAAGMEADYHYIFHGERENRAFI